MEMQTTNFTETRVCRPGLMPNPSSWINGGWSCEWICTFSPASYVISSEKWAQNFHLRKILKNLNNEKMYFFEWDFCNVSILTWFFPHWHVFILLNVEEELKPVVDAALKQLFPRLIILCYFQRLSNFTFIIRVVERITFSVTGEYSLEILVATFFPSIETVEQKLFKLNSRSIVKLKWMIEKLIWS